LGTAIFPKRNTKTPEHFLPSMFAEVIADAEAHAAQGALEDDSHTLSRLIGGPTTSLAQAVESALKTPPAAHLA